MNPAERLLSRVDTTSPFCWEWTAARDTNGYGRFSIDGRMEYAHRAAYELLVGPIPEGLTLDHLCRTRHCVRPSHLEAVSLGENVRRGFAFRKAAHKAKQDCGIASCRFCQSWRRKAA